MVLVAKAKCAKSETAADTEVHEHLLGTVARTCDVVVAHREHPADPVRGHFDADLGSDGPMPALVDVAAHADVDPAHDARATEAECRVGHEGARRLGFTTDATRPDPVH